MSTVPDEDGPARRLLAALDANLQPVPSPLDAKYAAIWAAALGVDPPQPEPDDAEDPSLTDYRDRVRDAVESAFPRAHLPPKAEPTSILKFDPPHAQILPRAARNETQADPKPRYAISGAPGGTYQVQGDAAGQLVLELDLPEQLAADRLLVFRFVAPNPTTSPPSPAELITGVVGLPAELVGTSRVALNGFIADPELLPAMAGWRHGVALVDPGQLTRADEPLLTESRTVNTPTGRGILDRVLRGLQTDRGASPLPNPTVAADFLHRVCDPVAGLWTALTTTGFDLHSLHDWLAEARRTRDAWLVPYRTETGLPDLRFWHLLEGVSRAAESLVRSESATLAEDAFRAAWEEEPGDEARHAATAATLAVRDAIRRTAAAPTARVALAIVFDQALAGQVLRLVLEAVPDPGEPTLYPDPTGPWLAVMDAAFRGAVANAWRLVAHRFTAGVAVRWRIEQLDGRPFCVPAVFEGTSAGAAFAVGLSALALRLGSDDLDERIAVSAELHPDGTLTRVDDAGLRNKVRALRAAGFRGLVVAENQPAADGFLLPARTADAALDHFRPPPEIPHLSHEQLPRPVDTKLFIGRDDTMELIDRCWRERETTIVQVVAPGGVGKSTVVWKWLRELLPQRHNYRLCPQVFEWSFYSQGKHEYQTDSGRFLQEAQRHFTRHAENPSAGQANGAEAWVAAERVAEQFMAAGGVMVLDGCEPLQRLPAAHRRSGAVDDIGLARVLAILKQHARLAPGNRRRLLILTTRWRIADLDELDGPNSGALTLDLGTLAPADGAQLLRGFHLGSGPQHRLRLGADEELRSPAACATLEDMSRDVGGHPLALVLLSSLLVRNHGGRVEDYAHLHADLLDDAGSGDAAAFDPNSPDEHRSARRVIRLYNRTLTQDQSPLAVATQRVLLQLGLFDRPARKERLKLLQVGDPIPGVTDLPPGTTVEAALAHLEDLRLVTIDPQPTGSVTAHPLLREYFSRVCQRENPGGWAAAHSRLYEGIVGPARPIDREDLEPWFEKMVHGCRAGLHEKALREVFVERVLRGDKWSAVPVRGAFGTVLTVLSHFFEPGKDWSFVPTLPDLEDQLVVLKHVGDCVSPTKGYAAEETLRCYTRGIELSDADSALWRLNYIFRVGHCRVLIGEGDCPRTIQACEELDRLEYAASDPIFRAASAARLAIAYLNAGQFEDAGRAADVALREPLTIETGRVAAQLFLVEATVAAYLWKALPEWHLGRVETAQQLVDQGVARARELNHPHTLVVALCFAGFISRYRGDVARTRELGEELIAYSQEHGYYFWRASAYTMTGWAAVQDGNPAEGLRLLERGIEGWLSGGCRVHIPYWRSLMAEALHRLGRTGEALDLLRGIETDAERRGELYWLPEIKRLKVTLGKHPPGSLGFGEEQEQALEDAIALAVRLGARMLHVRGLLSLLEGVLARRPRDDGKVAAVRYRLARAIAAVEEPGGCPFVAKARELLG